MRLPPRCLPTQPTAVAMKLCSFSLPLFATLLLLMTGCASSAKTKPTQKAAATPAPAAGGTAGAPVVTTPSGLRYQVLASGPAEGKSPTLNDSALTQY